MGIWSARDFLRAELVLCWQRQRGRRSYRTVLEARWRHVAYICNVGQGVGGEGGGKGEGGREEEEEWSLTEGGKVCEVTLQ